MEAHAAVDAASARDRNYDLASLDVFRKAIVQIRDNYVEPQRIQPREMFVAALGAVEKQVAEVMVEGSTLRVRAGEVPRAVGAPAGGGGGGQERAYCGGARRLRQGEGDGRLRGRLSARSTPSGRSR